MYKRPEVGKCLMYLAWRGTLGPGAGLILEKVMSGAIRKQAWDRSCKTCEVTVKFLYTNSLLIPLKGES